MTRLSGVRAVHASNDVMIPADHSAPMLAAPSVAEVVIPFLTEGKLVSSTTPQKRLQRFQSVREREHSYKQSQSTCPFT